jgi:hypothetical protein
LNEPGTIWIRNLTNPAAGHALYTTLLTGPEVVSAIFRKVRTGLLTIPAARRMANNFRANWTQQYAIVATEQLRVAAALGLPTENPDQH